MKRALKQLLLKNSSRLSAHCYAYRTDLTLHDAVLDIAADLRGRKRLFVAEFDFRKYFESISHTHLEEILKNRRFFVTDTELSVIRAFLRAPTLTQNSYNPDAPPDRERGIPQGTSVSLFLANIAAHPLDKRLERLGVGFARFADDTLIWSEDYSRVCSAATALEEAAGEMGVELNFAKSDGISLLLPEGAKGELSKTKHAVEFIGYRISGRAIGIRARSVKQIKQSIGKIIYTNLLREPSKGNLVLGRVAPTVDRDYVTAIRQIRRYMYGDLTETQLRRYLARDRPRIQYQGLMSFYPIVDDDALLKSLDGWLVHTLYTSLRARAKIFSAAGALLPEPHGFSKSALLSFVGRSSGGTNMDLSVPSFARISKLLRHASSIYGANAVANSQTLYGASRPNTGATYWPPII